MPRTKLEVDIYILDKTIFICWFRFLIHLMVDHGRVLKYIIKKV